MGWGKKKTHKRRKRRMSPKINLREGRQEARICLEFHDYNENKQGGKGKDRTRVRKIKVALNGSIHGLSRKKT